MEAVMAKSMKEETGMGQALDSMTTYAVAILGMLMAGVLVHASAILTIGGLILMALRLYVDGSKAWRTYKRNKDPSYSDDD